ncbi:hypothetical protein CK203_008506 [Vitis vinifera]|uniref:Uncharacterized protein n=1 Tax=Vitis vinifera TaxID=29760 RepID=A0A438KP78_VITVI|nr:hypothetical protein CK203_008506 [Vitis vinifera]
MTTHGTRSPTAIHFNIDGRQGILEARHVAEDLYIPYEPMDPTDFREWSPEKVHKKKLQRADTIPLTVSEDKLSTESVPPAPTIPMPEATYTAPPTTHVVPPDAPSTSEASITISAIEFPGPAYCYPSSDSTASGTSATTFKPDILGPLEPIAPVEETIPTEETTRAMSQSSPLRRPPRDIIFS